MSLLTSVALFALGLALVIVFAEHLVEGAVGTSAGFGLSPFLVSVVFIGFDPENLAVEAAGAHGGVPGIALGSVVGAAMVAIALAFGLTALIVPMQFERAPGGVLAVPLVAVLLFATLAWDGSLSRLDPKQA
jgi:cation:H+ antiporter